MKKAFLVFLSYDIMFNDADHGDCFAGNGQYDLRLFDNEEKAQKFIDDHNDTFKNAFKENKKQVFPRLKNQAKLYENFGIDLYSLDSNMDDPKLNYKVLKLE